MARKPAEPKIIEGPWIAVLEDEGYDEWSIRQANTGGSGWYVEVARTSQNLPTANLIAATPELFEALSKIVHHVERGGLLKVDEVETQLLVNAKRVIEKYGLISEFGAAGQYRGNA